MEAQQNLFSKLKPNFVWILSLSFLILFQNFVWMGFPSWTLSIKHSLNFLLCSCWLVSDRKILGNFTHYVKYTGVLFWLCKKTRLIGTHLVRDLTWFEQMQLYIHNARRQRKRNRIGNETSLQWASQVSAKISSRQIWHVASLVRFLQTKQNGRKNREPVKS